MVSWGVLGSPGGSGLALGTLIGSGWLPLLACAAACNSGSGCWLAQLRAVAAILALARKLGVDFGVDFGVPGCASLGCSCGRHCGGNRWWW